MTTVVSKVLDLLTPAERRQSLLLVPLVIAMALAEVAGVASITPFLVLMADPDAARTVPALAWAYETFGFRDDRAFLLASGVVVMAVLFAANGLLAAGFWLLTRFGAMRNHSISQRLLDTYLRQPYTFFLRHNSAALANNVLQEVAQVVNNVILPGLHLVAKCVAVAAVITLLVVIDPLLAALVGIVLGGAYALLSVATQRYITRIGKERVSANQARHRITHEAFGAIRELRLLNRESSMVDRYSGPSYDFARYEVGHRIVGMLPRYALETIAFASIVAVVMLLMDGGRAVSELVPVLGLYAFAGYRLLPALQQVFQGISQIRFGLGALDELHSIFAAHELATQEVHEPQTQHAQQKLPFRDRVRFENVTFAHPGSLPVLRSIDLEIHNGESIALVGRTGAGKSTLIDLLLGLLEPSSGAITIDGVPLDRNTHRAWHEHLGYVPQSIYLLDDTVARNIALGHENPDIDMRAVRRAARIAQIDAFIEQELPQGYETLIGEQGLRLSGGQRQRIGIARALYRDPSVLVFDEATSALDGVTEQAFLAALQVLPGTRTTIAITHRVSTIRSCDRVFVLDGGRIVAGGTLAEVAEASETIRSMIHDDGGAS